MNRALSPLQRSVVIAMLVLPDHLFLHVSSSAAINNPQPVRFATPAGDSGAMLSNERTYESKDSTAGLIGEGASSLPSPVPAASD
jgi:hypothetical protein